MTLAISLQPIVADHAQAMVGEQHLADFDPRALLVEQPLHLESHRRIGPEQYRQRLLAALGGPALLERLAALPRAPHPEGALVLCIGDPPARGAG